MSSSQVLENLEIGSSPIPTFVEDMSGGVFPKNLYAKTHHKHVIQLAQYRDEIRDKLNWAEDIEHRAAAYELGEPRHPGVGERPQDDANLIQQLPCPGAQGAPQTFQTGLLLVFHVPTLECKQCIF